MRTRKALTFGVACAILVATALVVSSCAHYSTSGGLPSHLETIGAEFFENETTETGLSEYMTRALNDVLISRPQFRFASARTADVVIRGTVVNVVDEPLTYSGGQPTEYQLLVRVDAEAYDQVKRRTLWQREGLVGQGTYDPSRGLVARQEAFEASFRELAGRIVDGVTSGW